MKQLYIKRDKIGHFDLVRGSTFFVMASITPNTLILLRPEDAFTNRRAIHQSAQIKGCKIKWAASINNNISLLISAFFIVVFIPFSV